LRPKADSSGAPAFDPLPAEPQAKASDTLGTKPDICSAQKNAFELGRVFIPSRGKATARVKGSLPISWAPGPFACPQDWCLSYPSVQAFAAHAKFAARRHVFAGDEVARGVARTRFTKVPKLLPLRLVPILLHAAPIVQPAAPSETEQWHARGWLGSAS
jgi:hypothetical protein